MYRSRQFNVHDNSLHEIHRQTVGYRIVFCPSVRSFVFQSQFSTSRTFERNLRDLSGFRYIICTLRDNRLAKALPQNPDATWKSSQTFFKWEMVSSFMRPLFSQHRSTLFWSSFIASELYLVIIQFLLTILWFLSFPHKYRDERIIQWVQWHLDPDRSLSLSLSYLVNCLTRSIPLFSI